MRPVKVLYVNHTAQVSGAERSLLELMKRAGADAEVILACPAGDLISQAHELGVATVELSPPQIAFSSGPPELIRVLAGIVRTGLQLRAFVQSQQVDIVHAASTRAGLLAGFCVFSPAERVVDVRDALPRGLKAQAVRWTLRVAADRLVFNSAFTRSRFGSTWPARNLVSFPAIDLKPLLDLPLPRVEIHTGAPVLGMIGQITPWKGQDDAIRILASVRKRVPGVRLRIIGSVIFAGGTVSFDNEAFRDGLPILAAELGVADAVEFVAETDDIRSALESIDILLVPSCEEPFGRVVAEGMAAGVPVVATSVGGPAEVIEHGISGFLADPNDCLAWVESVTGLLESVELSTQVARAARERIVAVLDGGRKQAHMRALHPLTVGKATARSRR